MKKLSIVIVIAAVGFCLADAGQELQNGTFDSDLSGWTVSPAGTDAVLWYQETAVILNPGDFPLDQTWPFQDSFSFLSSYPNPAGGDVSASSLSQVFLLPDNANKLSFDMTMEVYRRITAGPETDTLTVTLYCGSQSEVIYQLTSTQVEALTDPEDLLVDEDEFDYDEGVFTHHVIYNTPVECDVSLLAGQNVTIDFELGHDIDDDVITTVTIDDVVVSVAADTTPPAVEIGEMTELWPPNHKYHTFNLSDIVLSVGDDIDGEINIDESCVILSIYSDEPEDLEGEGDGNTVDDIVILGPSSFKVLSERQGTGNGRVYGITFIVFDSSGNSAVATVYLGVPHDKSGKTPIEDDGSASGYEVYY
jgi:hypothetical protein